MCGRVLFGPLEPLFSKNRGILGKVTGGRLQKVPMLPVTFPEMPDSWYFS